MFDFQKVHLIGAGGIGVSAAGKFFIMHGAQVTGSDLQFNRQTDELLALDAEIVEGDGLSLIGQDTELILYSPAVKENHPEREKGRELGIKELSYPEFLGELSQYKKTIAISGTNGKSTTTAMLAKILISAGYDPMVFLGTFSADLSHGNYHHGQGVWMIVEACEYKNAMLNIKPHIASITNIEADHLDFFKDINHIISSFQEWCDYIKPFDGYVVLNHDNKNIHQIKRDDAIVVNVKNRMTGNQLQSFTADISGDIGIATKIPLKLTAPGIYNAENAAIASAIARILHINEDIIKDSLYSFTGTWRRFEHLGEFKGYKVFSDYAHHPSAISGLITAIKEQFPNDKISLIFEPHQHARTKELFNDFVQAFNDADRVIITDIYGVAGRMEQDFISSANLVAEIKKSNQDLNIEHISSPVEAMNSIENGHGLLLVVGAGTIDEQVRTLIK